MRIGKEFNFIAISLIFSLAFLCNATLYSGPLSERALRIPVGRKSIYSDMSVVYSETDEDFSETDSQKAKFITNTNGKLKRLQLVDVIGDSKKWIDINQDGLLSRGLYAESVEHFSSVKKQMEGGFTKWQTKIGVGLLERSTVKMGITINRFGGPVSLELNKEALRFGRIWRTDKSGNVHEPDNFGFVVIISDSVKIKERNYEVLGGVPEANADYVRPKEFTGFIVHENNLKKLQELLKQWKLTNLSSLPIYVMRVKKSDLFKLKDFKDRRGHPSNSNL